MAVQHSGGRSHAQPSNQFLPDIVTKYGLETPAATANKDGSISKYLSQNADSGKMGTDASIDKVADSLKAQQQEVSSEDENDEELQLNQVTSLTSPISLSFWMMWSQMLQSSANSLRTADNYSSSENVISLLHLFCTSNKVITLFQYSWVISYLEIRARSMKLWTNKQGICKFVGFEHCWMQFRE